MSKLLVTASFILLSGLFAMSSCTTQEEMVAKPAPAQPPAKAEAKAPAKAKVEKARGDVGLLDTDKNYMILVTKEGKLITLDFDNKTKVTKITPGSAKVADIGLGSAATVTYGTNANKNIATSIEYKAKKGGD